MKFIVLGNYNENGLSGFIKNPNEDRKSVITSMMEKAGGKLDNLFLTRGKYDIVAICDAPDFETMGALKMLIMNSGAIWRSHQIVMLVPLAFSRLRCGNLVYCFQSVQKMLLTLCRRASLV